MLGTCHYTSYLHMNMIYFSTKNIRRIKYSSLILTRVVGPEIATFLVENKIFEINKYCGFIHDSGSTKSTKILCTS